MLVDLLVDIAAALEPLGTQKVAVTPGRPAATDKCSAVYVWGSQIFDSDVGVQARGDIAGCVYRRAYVINYRIDVCMDLHEDGSELTTAEYLAKATELYNLADEAFCALTHAASNGTLFDPANHPECKDINFQQLVITEPQGDRVSAEGTIRVTHPCEPEGS